jgi:hypothetical protein
MLDSIQIHQIKPSDPAVVLTPEAIARVLEGHMHSLKRGHRALRHAIRGAHLPRGHHWHQNPVLSQTAHPAVWAASTGAP